MTSVRVLTKNAIIYGLGFALARGVGFLLLPVYTRYLTPADYGLLALLELTVDVAAMFFSVGMTSGLSRFYFKASDEDERKAIVCSALLLETGLAAVAATLLWLAAPLVHTRFLSPTGSVGLVRLAAVNFWLGTLAAVPALLLQLRNEAAKAVTTNMVRLVLMVAVALTLLVGFRLGVWAMLWATFVGNLVVGISLSIWVLRYTGWRPRRQAFRDLRRFGVPNQVAWMGSFILNFGDRFFLQRARGAADVGLYGVAYQFAFLLMYLGYSPVLKALNPLRHELSHAPAEHRDIIYNEFLRLFAVVILTIAVGIALLSRPVLAVMTAPAFHTAAAVIPVLLLAYVFEAFTQFSLLGIEAAEQTGAASRATWAAVVVAVPAYALLIPRWGAMGAAMATVLCMAVRAVGIYGAAQRLWPIAYHWGHVSRTAVAAVASVGAAQLSHPASVWLDGLQASVLSVLFIGLAWKSGLTGHDRSRVLRFASERVNAILGRESGDVPALPPPPRRWRVTSRAGHKDTPSPGPSAPR